MRDPKDRTSVFIALVLRHNPEAANLTLDKHGWADVRALVRGVRQAQGISFDIEALREIVANDEKGRYRFSDDGMRIRANQGHSVAVDVELTAQIPPPILFHGTARKFAQSIKADGLLPQNRLYVHLSEDLETALSVGARHGAPVVFQIDAAAMGEAGHIFYRSENGVWLCKGVPARYLSFVHP